MLEPLTAAHVIHTLGTGLLELRPGVGAHRQLRFAAHRANKTALMILEELGDVFV